MTFLSSNKHDSQHPMMPVSIFEDVITQLLEHDDRQSLRTSFIAMVDGYYQPERIQLYSSGLRGIVSYRGCELAHIMIRDILDEGSESAKLGDDQKLLKAVECAEFSHDIDNAADVDLYIPIIEGGSVGTVLVLRKVSADIVNDSIWQHILLAYSNLNRMLYRAEIDPLTGLMNRLAFDRLLEQQVKEQSEVTNTYFAIIDIDFFKKVNDNFGHLYGDEVLILLSRTMSDEFRSIDWLFRYGGEEFALVLNDLTQQQAESVLQRFRNKIEMTNFPQVGKITVSIGFTLMVASEAVSLLIDRADQALYYAKETGRNQVLFYEDLVKKNLLAKTMQEHTEAVLF